MKNLKLIGFRRMAGFTQEDMARIIGVARVTYIRKENGERQFKKSEMKLIHEKLSEALKLFNFKSITISHIFY